MFIVFRKYVKETFFQKCLFSKSFLQTSFAANWGIEGCEGTSKFCIYIFLFIFIIHLNYYNYCTSKLNNYQLNTFVWIFITISYYYFVCSSVFVSCIFSFNEHCINDFFIVCPTYEMRSLVIWKLRLIKVKIKDF